MFLRKQNIKSVNLINKSIDNIQATELMRKVESQAGYNFLTGNGSNPINSKTVQQEIKVRKSQMYHLQMLNQIILNL